MVMAGDNSTDLVAEVCSVKDRLPNLGFAIQDHYQFILWHKEFVTIDYLLQPNVTLYFIDDTVAMFVQHPNSSDLYNTEKFPFFFMGQHKTCATVILLPLRQLVKLTKKIGKPKCDVTWVLHSGRCCSTALAQALYPLPQWTVIAETAFLHKHLAVVHKNRLMPFDEYVSSDQFHAFGESAINFMLKDFPPGKKVLWKMPAILDFCTIIPIIAARFEDHKLITLHRDGINTCKSFYQAHSNHTILNMAILALNYNLPAFISEPILDPILFIFTSGMRSELEDYLRNETVDVFRMDYTRWVTNMIQFLRYAKRVKSLRSYIYDDMRFEQEKTMKEIYEYLDIPLEYLPLSMKALERDSQQGSILDRNKMAKKSSWSKDATTVKACEKLLAKYNLPGFDQKFRFDENREIQLI